MVIVVLTNSPGQTQALLHSLEQAAGVIGLHVNADKAEYSCFNQIGDVSTLNGRKSLHKNAACCIEQVLNAKPYKRAAVRPPTTRHEN